MKTTSQVALSSPSVKALMRLVEEEESVLRDLAVAVEARDDKRTLVIAKRLAELRTPSAAVIAQKR